MLNVSPVRRALPDDVADLKALVREHHEESGLKVPMDDTLVDDMIKRHFNRGGATIGVIRARDRKIEASICLLISTMWYTGQFHLEAIWIHVRPEYRAPQLKNLEHLIEFAKRCSDTLGLPVFSGNTSGKETAPAMRIFRRLMGEPVGAFFMYEPKGENERPPADA